MSKKMNLFLSSVAIIMAGIGAYISQEGVSATKEGSFAAGVRLSHNLSQDELESIMRNDIQTLREYGTEGQAIFGRSIFDTESQGTEAVWISLVNRK